MFSTAANLDLEFAMYALVFTLVLLTVECTKLWLVNNPQNDPESITTQALINRVIYTVLIDVSNIFSLTWEIDK